MVQLSHLYMTTGKTVALPVWTFVGKVISLFFNTLSWFAIAFLPRSKCLLILWLQSLSAVILEPKKIKSVTVSIFSPSIYRGTRCHDLSFLNTEFQVSFFSLLSPSSRGSSLSAIRLVSSANLRLLIFLLAILIPSYDSSSLAFYMMYCAYRLNKQGRSTQPSCTPLTVLNQFFHVWF